MRARLDEFFREGGPLSSIKPGYRVRPAQLRLARAVGDALKTGDTLLSEGPPGTGKSLAYAAAAAVTDRPVVISTATIALQHQLINEDLPVLAKAMELMGGEKVPSFALMKGRSNFICGARLDGALAQGGGILPGLDPDRGQEELERIAAWSAETPSGDREELLFAPPPGLWSQVASDSDDCVPQRCPHRPRCPYFVQRDLAQKARFLVVNHALLFANLASYGSIFSMEGRDVIIDEAHRIEEVMAEAYGRHVTRGRVGYVTRAVGKKAPEAARFVERVENAADLFFDQLRTKNSLGDQKGAPPATESLLGALLSLRAVVRNNPKEEVAALSSMVGKLHKDLKSFYEPLEEADYAYAVLPAKRSGRPPELKSWLVSTEKVFGPKVAGRPEGGATVLTSATLAAGSSFRYLRRRLGLHDAEAHLEAEDSPGEDSPGEERPPRRVRELVTPTTFDYEKNCLIYIERELPEPGRENIGLYTEGAVRRTEQLIEESGGRALVLCSTHKALSHFKRSLEVSYPVRFQGEASPSRLVEWLKSTKGGVLVGTRTLSEGVDVPGEALSLLVIDRVSFPPPDDPVIERLCEKAGRRGWFGEVSLPRAQISLKQSAGRLIRTVHDRGVIAVLDPRITTKRWGPALFGSLPPGAGRTSSLDDVAAFYASTALRGDAATGGEAGLPRRVTEPSSPAQEAS